jgi:hypothetical protein
LREVLAQALYDRKVLQHALNTILRDQTLRFVKERKWAYYIAIDLTLTPYHDEQYADEKSEVSQNQSPRIFTAEGATVSIVRDNQRYVVAL